MSNVLQNYPVMLYLRHIYHILFPKWQIRFSISWVTNKPREKHLWIIVNHICHFASQMIPYLGPPFTVHNICMHLCIYFKTIPANYCTVYNVGKYYMFFFYISSMWAKYDFRLIRLLSSSSALYVFVKSFFVFVFLIKPLCYSCSSLRRGFFFLFMKNR
jgi:hypothetical protein